MTRIIKCCLLLAAVGLCVFAGMAQAQDTSPYLVGFWSDQYNDFTILNPTTKPLTVYAIYYNAGNGYPGMECYKWDLPPNGVWYADMNGGTDGNLGTAKFFAFPAGTRKFDPNAVIGGFQVKYISAPISFYVEANLKAVTINSYTLREFSMIPADDADCFKEPKEPK